MLVLGQTDPTPGQLWRLAEKKAIAEQGFVAYAPDLPEPERIAPAPKPIPIILPRVAPRDLIPVVAPPRDVAVSRAWWILALVVAVGAGTSIYMGQR